MKAVVGCGRVRYRFPGVSQTWQLGCSQQQNDSSATVEASEAPL